MTEFGLPSISFKRCLFYWASILLIMRKWRTSCLFLNTSIWKYTRLHVKKRYFPSSSSFHETWYFKLKFNVSNRTWKPYFALCKTWSKDIRKQKYSKIAQKLLKFCARKTMLSIHDVTLYEALWLITLSISYVKFLTIMQPLLQG